MPSAVKRSAMATVKKPQGTPWAKYSPPKISRRERKVAPEVTPPS